MKLNNITVLGHVGSVRAVHSKNTDVLNIDLACNRTVGDKEYVDWYKAKVWGEFANELEPQIQKGDQLKVSGRVEAKGYLRKDGTAGADLVLHADDVQLMSCQLTTTAEPESEQEDGDQETDSN